MYGYDDTDIVLNKPVEKVEVKRRVTVGILIALIQTIVNKINYSILQTWE